MAEASYFYPILNVLKNHPHPIIAYSVEIGNVCKLSYVNSMDNCFPAKPVLLGEWSKFDKTIPAWLIRDAFRILSEAINWNYVQDFEGKLWNIREYRSKCRWRAIVKYFIDTPIRKNNREKFVKHCGVPSESFFTNIIDSIAKAIVIRYLVYETTGQFPIADVYLRDE